MHRALLETDQTGTDTHRAAPAGLSRRAVVVSSLWLPPAVLSASLSGCQGGASVDRQLSFDSLADAEDELGRLAAAKSIVSGAAWTWPQTLEHCAQSIEYSMAGFPEPKSRLFQSTVGAAAFGVFSWRGRMTHDLAEPIPGAPALAAGAGPEAALARLRTSIASFRAWSQPLQPHFAYGALDKRSYEMAHAMHLANHLSQFKTLG
jgi:hypothetical protein